MTMHLSPRFHTALVGLGLTALAAAPAAAQGLNGQPVQMTFRFPDSSTVFSTIGTGTVVPGGVTFASDLNGLTSTVTPTQIRIANNGAGTINLGGVGPGFSFEGYVLSEMGGSPVTITSLSVDPATTVAGFGANQLSFDAGDVFANFQNTTLLAGQNVTIDVNPPAVPEASTTVSLGLLLTLGLGGMVIAARRKKRA